jgi:predicted secreted hydrolase
MRNHPVNITSLLRHLAGSGLLLAASMMSVVAQEAADGWRTAEPGWTYAFPSDHGSHPPFKTEWWYFTGNLKSDDGHMFGFQLTFFRQGVIPPSQIIPKSDFLTRDVKFAHFALTDISGAKFRHAQRLSRGAFGEAGFDDPPRVAWIKDWTCSATGANSFTLRAADSDFAIDLALTPKKPPVIHGSDGISRKADGPGRASHYYSLTRLETNGTLRAGERTFRVHGLSWFDHEWATNQLAEHQTGWDWFSIQFDDGSELMLFQIRTGRNARDPNSGGTFIDPAGNTVPIADADFTLEPLKFWTSGSSKAKYPVTWRIRIPKLSVEVTAAAAIPNQELDTQPFTYWEGSILAQGKRGDQPLRGRGYLEMTGYAGRIVGLTSK